MLVRQRQPVYSFTGKPKEPSPRDDSPGPGNYSPRSMFDTGEC